MRSVQNFITIAARHGKDMRPFLMRSVGKNPQRLAAQNAAERAFLRSGVRSRSGERAMRSGIRLAQWMTPRSPLEKPMEQHMTPTHKTPVTYADDVAGLRLQLWQALIALSSLEAEIVGPMRQSELLAIIQNQLGNINTAADSPAF